MPAMVMSGAPRRRARAIVAFGIAGFALLTSVAALLSWANRTPVDVVTFVALPLAFGGVGAFLVVRVPGNVIGPILLGAAVGFSLLIGSGAYVVLGTHDGVYPPGAVLAAIAANLMFIPSLVAVLVGVPLLFPDGRFLSARWRWVAITAAVLVGLALAAPLFGNPTLSWGNTLPNPFYIPSAAPALRLLDTFTSVAAVPVFALSLWSLLLRYRRSDDVGRHQIRWLVATAGVSATAFTISFLVPPLSDAMGSIGTVALNAIPVAIGIAIVRYRLYDIDRLISRGLTYVALSILLAGAYAVAVIVLQGPLGGTFGGDTLTVAVSTLIVAALFQPVRARLQRAMDRRFDRTRIDADRTAAAFADRVRDQVDIEAVAGELTSTVRGAIRPRHVAIWLRDTA
jgi:hypothetical protein